MFIGKRRLLQEGEIIKLSSKECEVLSALWDGLLWRMGVALYVLYSHRVRSYWSSCLTFWYKDLFLFHCWYLINSCLKMTSQRTVDHLPGQRQELYDLLTWRDFLTWRVLSPGVRSFGHQALRVCCFNCHCIVLEECDRRLYWYIVFFKGVSQSQKRYGPVTLIVLWWPYVISL